MGAEGTCLNSLRSVCAPTAQPAEVAGERRAGQGKADKGPTSRGAGRGNRDPGPRGWGALRAGGHALLTDKVERGESRQGQDEHLLQWAGRAGTSGQGAGRSTGLVRCKHGGALDGALDLSPLQPPGVGETSGWAGLESGR